MAFFMPHFLAALIALSHAMMLARGEFSRYDEVAAAAAAVSARLDGSDVTWTAQKRPDGPPDRVCPVLPRIHLKSQFPATPPAGTRLEAILVADGAFEFICPHDPKPRWHEDPTGSRFKLYDFGAKLAEATPPGGTIRIPDLRTFNAYRGTGDDDAGDGDSAELGPLIGEAIVFHSDYEEPLGQRITFYVDLGIGSGKRALFNGRVPGMRRVVSGPTMEGPGYIPSVPGPSDSQRGSVAYRVYSTYDWKSRTLGPAQGPRPDNVNKECDPFATATDGSDIFPVPARMLFFLYAPPEMFPLDGDGKRPLRPSCRVPPARQRHRLQLR